MTTELTVSVCGPLIKHLDSWDSFGVGGAAAAACTWTQRSPADAAPQTGSEKADEYVHIFPVCLLNMFTSCAK